MQNIRLSRNIIVIYKHKDPLLAQNFLCKFVYIQLCAAKLLDLGAIMTEFHKNIRLETQMQSVGAYLQNTCLQHAVSNSIIECFFLKFFEYTQFFNIVLLNIINPVLVWAHLFPDSFQMPQAW